MRGRRFKHGRDPYNLLLGTKYLGQVGRRRPGTTLYDPEQVEPTTAAGNVESRRVSPNFNHTSAIATDGQIDCWGNNDKYLLGVSGPGTATPQQVVFPSQ